MITLVEPSIWDIFFAIQTFSKMVLKWETEQIQYMKAEFGK